MLTARIGDTWCTVHSHAVFLVAFIDSTTDEYISCPQRVQSLTQRAQS